MKNYLELVERVHNEGAVIKNDRTQVGTRSLFGESLEFDLGDGFPAVTTKRLAFKTMLRELLWFITGETNVKPLQDRSVRIWDEWADKNGDLGPVYGKQWRFWDKYVLYAHDEKCNPVYVKGKPIDQLANVVAGLTENPFSRRHIVSAWNVADLPHMALAPCHMTFQFHVRPMLEADRLLIAGKRVLGDGKEKRDYMLFGWGMKTAYEKRNGGNWLEEIPIPDYFLDCMVTQRSADLFLGVPFNIASYATLTHMIAYLTGYQAGKLRMNFGNVHLYLNHEKQTKELLSRKPLPPPALRILPEHDIKTIDDFTENDIHLHNYQSHAAISAPIAV